MFSSFYFLDLFSFKRKIEYLIEVSLINLLLNKSNMDYSIKKKLLVMLLIK